MAFWGKLLEIPGNLGTCKITSVAAASHHIPLSVVTVSQGELPSLQLNPRVVVLWIWKVMYFYPSFYI